MKTLFSILLNIAISVFVTVGVILYFLYESEEYEFHPDIEHVEPVISGKTLKLKITVRKPMGCQRVQELIGINNKTLPGRTHYPVCKVIDDTTIHITFKELVSI